jgi:hypothetical protein
MYGSLSAEPARMSKRLKTANAAAICRSSKLFPFDSPRLPRHGWVSFRKRRNTVLMKGSGTTMAARQETA